MSTQSTCIGRECHTEGSQSSASSSSPDASASPHDPSGLDRRDPRDKVFMTPELRTNILNHLSARDVAALHKATRLPLNKEDAAKFMDPIRELGKLGDAITVLEKSGAQVLLAGKGIRALRDGIRTPTADIANKAPLVLALMITNITNDSNDALVLFFAKLRCQLEICPTRWFNKSTYQVYRAKGPFRRRLCREHGVLIRVTPRVFVLLPGFFTPTMAEFTSSAKTKAIPSMTDNADAAGERRMDLEVARASSLWHSATVSSRTYTIEKRCTHKVSIEGWDQMQLVLHGSESSFSRVDCCGLTTCHFRLASYLDELSISQSE